MFVPNYDKWESKIAKFSKFPKKSVSKLHNFEKKVHNFEKKGLIPTVGWKRGSMLQSLPTNLIYGVPPPPQELISILFKIHIKT